MRERTFKGKIALIIFITALMLCPIQIIDDETEFSFPITINGDILPPVYSDMNFSMDSVQSYIHRGDWERPDILLMTEAPGWQDSVELIVAAAYRDGIPAYILTDRNDLKQEDHLSLLKKKYKAQILEVSYDTPWIRDYGPIQLKTWGNAAYWLDFYYATERPNDDSVPQQLAEYMDVQVQHENYYLEGGAIVSNGKGICAITEKSLNEALDDQTSSEELALFKKLLGCRSLAILPVLTGEITGHADVIAQFLSHDIVAVAVVDQELSEIQAELEKAVDSLMTAADAIGQKLRIVRVPIHVEDEYFYSYVNGTRLNNSYLIPSFENVPSETEFMAYNVIRSVIPEVKLIPVPADHMVERGGAVHCITLGLSLPRHIDVRQYWVKEDKAIPLKILSVMKKIKDFDKKSFNQMQDEGV
jgi:agmatine deiminase